MNDYRPVSILPVMSKIFERVVMKQIVSFIDKEQLLYERVCGYRKGHSTVTALLGIKDMIMQAMGKGEITLMVLADFSKAFDTIDYKTLIHKMHALHFSNCFLKWLLSYLDDRYQFVQVDDKASELKLTTFGVPQGSILGPVLFNLYVTDLQDKIQLPCFQYADDTTILAHGRPKDLPSLETALNEDLEKLISWSSSTNLALNPKKTKVMVMSTNQLSKKHSLQSYSPVLKIGAKHLEREHCSKLLGVTLNEHLSWDDHIAKVTSSCFSTMSILRKFRNLMPFKLKRQVAELLVLSKMDYADAIFRPLPLRLLKRLQKVQNAAASFVLGRYAKEKDVITLGWLPMKERRDWHLMKLSFKYLSDRHKPEYIDISLKEHTRNLRSNSAPLIATSTSTSNIFRNDAAELFNKLPAEIRNTKSSAQFSSQTRNILKIAAAERLLV